jgi:RNA recognition motif-containing protein
MDYSQDGFMVFLGGIPHNTRADDIRAWIKESGLPDVNHVRLTTDRQTGLCHGFCFVYAKNETDGRALVERFNGAPFPDGRVMRAEVGRVKAAGRND